MCMKACDDDKEDQPTITFEGVSCDNVFVVVCIDGGEVFDGLGIGWTNERGAKQFRFRVRIEHTMLHAVAAFSSEA